MANKTVKEAGFTEKGLDYLEEMAEDTSKETSFEYARKILEEAEKVNNVESDPYDQLTTLKPGKSITVENIGQAKNDPKYTPVTYRIVQSHDVELLKNKISVDNPVVETLVNEEATPGDVVEVESESGNISYYRLLGVAVWKEEIR